MKKIGYVVNSRSHHDDEVALEFVLLFPMATSKAEAWRYFLLTVGKDRQHWNKLGYIAEKVEYNIEFRKRN